MVAAFSAPILSVAADAVRDLEGRDALFGLWTVFTKCKQSLHNGARLENITWRLWHCERKGPEKFSQIPKESTLTEAESLTSVPVVQLPPTPSASYNTYPSQTPPADFTQPSTALQDAVISFSEVHAPPYYSLSYPPSDDATQPGSSSSRTTASRAVGRIICDFLPTKRDLDQPSTVDHLTDVPSWSPEAAAPNYQSNPKTALVPRCPMRRPSTIILPEARSLASCLPTPDTPNLGLTELEPSITRTATQSPSQFLYAGTMVNSTPGLPSEPPRLVVVKPTPSPTPQPTPPTTPLTTNPATAMQGNRSHWLSPLPLTREPISQSRYEEQNALIPDPADIWTIQMTEHEFAQDCADELSASSIASKSSEYSHATTTSVAWTSTTSASSIGYLHDEGEKPSDLIGATMRYSHIVGNLPLPTLHRRGSLSTIQSISTDRGRKAAVISSDISDATRDGSFGMVSAAGEQGSIKKGEPSTGSRASSSASKRRTKRNSAPVSIAPMPCAHVDQFPHHSLAAPISTENPTTPELASEQPTNSNSAMNRDSRSSGQSRSRESSATGSRSGSREPSGNPFADLSGIGTLGGYTIAAAYPPPNMTVRKQVAVGAGKGKVKLAFGRGLGGKSKTVRRNSAGSALEVSAKEKDKGSNHGSGGNLERVKSEDLQRSHLEDILEKPSIHQLVEEPQEGPPQVTLTHEDKVLQDSTSTAAATQATPQAALPSRYAELLTIGEAIQSVKRQPRFNIGSNSDDGSGMASKSVGSGSSQSGGHSLGQRGKMMENSQGPTARVTNEKTLDTLPWEERERQRREVEGEVQQRMHHNHPDSTVPLHKPMKQEIRHPKTTQHTHNVNLAVLERVQSSGRVSDKAKGGPKAIDHHPGAATSTSKPSSKTKSKSTPNLGSLDAVLAAKVRDSIGEPLLPKGRPVVVDSESEYETDTEDGTWSDEEMVDDAEAQKREQIQQELALQQERERQAAELKEQEVLLQQLYQQQQQNLPHQQHRGGRPAAAVQRTHSSHYPAPNNARTTKGPAQRNRNQQIRELALHHAKLEQAAKEAQRQRDMIQKLPRESFQDLAKARANSVGLLSQLLKPPNPDVLPPDHPHRVYSSGTIEPMALPPMPAIQPTTSDPGPATTAGTMKKVVSNGDFQQPAPEIGGSRPLQPRRHASTDEGRRRIPSWSRILSPIRGPPLQLTKSSAALPVSSQVQAGSVSSNGAHGAPSAAARSSRILGSKLTMTASGGYRPKGPPTGQEMEEDTDSEPETEKIQVSKSVAEQKLKALVEKRGIRQHQPVVVARTQPLAGSSKGAPPADEDVPDWARVSQPECQPERQRRPANGLQVTPLIRPPPSVPIPLGLPYKLPLPAPPTTPRTTRRQMLSTELSESLRRNLLWERQVSKSNLAAMRRSSSGVVNHHDGLGRTQPFASIAPVVQLHAKGTIPLDQQEDPVKRVSAPMTDNEREEMRRHAIARNRSWANDFHYAGW